MLHQRPNTFAQTCLLASAFSLQSDGGPYIYVHLEPIYKHWPTTRESAVDLKYLGYVSGIHLKWIKDHKPEREGKSGNSAPAR